jgi:hypothetical protein
MKEASTPLSDSQNGSEELGKPKSKTWFVRFFELDKHLAEDWCRCIKNLNPYILGSLESGQLAADPITCQVLFQADESECDRHGRLFCHHVLAEFSLWTGSHPLEPAATIPPKLSALFLLDVSDCHSPDILDPPQGLRHSPPHHARLVAGFFRARTRPTFSHHRISFGEILVRVLEGYHHIGIPDLFVHALDVVQHADICVL